jgi:hypothetical protein
MAQNIKFKLPLNFMYFDFIFNGASLFFVQAKDLLSLGVSLGIGMVLIDSLEVKTPCLA